MEYTVLVPHIGDKPVPYLKGETRTIDNEQWARELLANGVVGLKPDKPKPKPEPKPKSKK